MSIGNDIVALDAIDRQRTIHPRFYSKILSSCEQELYRGEQAFYPGKEFSGLPFANFVWLLWSIKESVFKYRQRIEPTHVFSPLKIVVQHLDLRGEHKGSTPSPWKAVVHSGSGVFYSRSTINDDYISTIVSEDEGLDKTWWGVGSIDRRDYAAQSASVRALLLDKLYSLLPAGHEILHIKKGQRGCPVLYKGEKESGIPISLAHHGHFVAWSFRL